MGRGATMRDLLKHKIDDNIPLVFRTFCCLSCT